MSLTSNRNKRALVAINDRGPFVLASADQELPLTTNSVRFTAFA
jgi:hypothetical protein